VGRVIARGLPNGARIATQFGYNQVLEQQHVECLGLPCSGVRVDGQEMIAEHALLLVRDLGGLQHLLLAPRARHHEGTAAGVAWQERAREPGRSSGPASSGDCPVAGEPVTRA